MKWIKYRWSRILFIETLYAMDISGTYDVLELSEKEIGIKLLNVNEVDNCFEECPEVDKKKLGDVILNLEKIDFIIKENLSNWQFDRLPKILVAILRNAVYEILFLNMQYKIIINESLDISKCFLENSFQRILNKILQDIVYNEVKEPSTNNDLQSNNKK